MGVHLLITIFSTFIHVRKVLEEEVGEKCWICSFI